MDRHAASTPAAAATIVVLCAAWCDTCRTFRSVFDRLADARRDARFIWLDIEDEAALVGDIDVENFPTLAVFRVKTSLGKVTLLLIPDRPLASRAAGAAYSLNAAVLQAVRGAIVIISDSPRSIQRTETLLKSS